MKTHAKTHGLRRFLCGLTALATAALMVPLSAMAETNPDPIETDSGVTLGKTATELDENNRTTVTLSIGSVQNNPPDSDIVFVLDKSTSNVVKDEAVAMLDELMERVNDNCTVSVGVVVFNRNGNEELPLTPLSNETYNSIVNALYAKESGGTNIQAGIEKGLEVLSQGSAEPENKHLVLVSDGITYLWGTDSNPLTVYNESQNGAYMTGPDEAATYWPSFKRDFLSAQDMQGWLDQAYRNGIESIRDTYQMEAWLNDGGSAPSYPPEEYVTSYIPWGSDVQYTANEIGIYQAGKSWEKAANLGYTLYAYCDTARDVSYPWGNDFILGLKTIGNTYTQSYTATETNVDGMFNNIRNSVLYEIMSGTVEDTIGDNFNLVGLETLKLTVGNQSYTGEVNGNTVVYDVNNDDNAEYEVTYTNSNSVEALTWKVNTPIEQGNGISLSYQLVVDSNSTGLPAPGTGAWLDTNEGATLDYEPTDGSDRETEEFPEPSVWYGTPGEESSGGGDEDPDEPENPPVIIPDDDPTISIVKKWVNDDPEDRPDSITVDIYKDGEYFDSMTISGRLFGDRDTWRDSYDIPARYADDEDIEWWVVESDVPAYYDSETEQRSDTVFYIYNTYEEPVIEEPVSSEPESSEPSSEPSEVIPSGPSEEPSAPSSEPTSEPSEPAEPTLPQTGQTWWPIIILLAGGAVLVAFGAFRTIRGNGRRER